jgi:malto-oligosyltrehalose trehalohydrolase
MPFGAAITADGAVRFRLWAPDQRAVKLRLGDDAGAEMAMHSRADGWFELTTSAATPGSRYSYVLDNGTCVPDPASRFQPDGVHGPSEVVDPAAYAWQDRSWRGRPWAEAVIYELHVGAFSPEGDYRGVMRHLDHLAALGVTAIELMPVASYAGRHGWGYDGVLPFAPHHMYGRPVSLKALIDAAHRRGLMVILDVVYNHFGPDGNFLGQYASAFFTERYHTPWGAAINFDGPGSDTVRRFFIDNALYWLEEYHFDGLRLDAVHAIFDASPEHVLEALARAVKSCLPADRHVHLVLENDANQARFLRRGADDQSAAYCAQWNDDFHHAAHVIATAEHHGYYQDYTDAPVAGLGRALAEGFIYQGQPSAFRDNSPRGEPSAHLPPTAFVNFLQNHDQIGNRAFGERLHALSPPEVIGALTTIALLAPSPPLLFMGQEWGAEQPFLFFCDFAGELAEAVRVGRRQEFASFPAFSDPESRRRIPDPTDESTFTRSKLDWNALAREPHRRYLAHCRHLLALRRRHIVPLLRENMGEIDKGWQCDNPTGLRVWWRFGGSHLTLLANLGGQSLPISAADGTLITAWRPRRRSTAGLAPWEVRWYLHAGGPCP